MGYGFYFAGGRPAGYYVTATCDKRGCNEEIDRGLGWLCGDDPGYPHENGYGCQMYFCESHGSGVGPRGGCNHRQQQAYGETLICMATRDNNGITEYCCRDKRTEHEHWVDEYDDEDIS